MKNVPFVMTDDDGDKILVLPDHTAQPLAAQSCVGYTSPSGVRVFFWSLQKSTLDALTSGPVPDDQPAWTRHVHSYLVFSPDQAISTGEALIRWGEESRAAAAKALK